MKKIITGLLVLSVLVLPDTVEAHGHTVFEINGKKYSFVLGSLNEPVAVDDKSGVDLRISTGVNTPVEGLYKNLQVEITAKDEKKVMDLSPAYGQPGTYHAYFIPTLETTYSYRIFGTIGNMPFDHTWACNPDGHLAASPATSATEVSPGVRLLEKTGSFGCPAAREDLGFPEKTNTIYELSKDVQSARTTAITAQTFGIIGMTFGIVALGALRRERKQK